MKIYPKKDIKNPYGQIIYHKGKGYECESFFKSQEEYYVVYCDLFSNEYPMMTMEEIRKIFFLENEMRDEKINKLL